MRANAISTTGQHGEAPGATEHPSLTQAGMHGAFVKDGLNYQPRVPQTSSRLEGLRLAVKDVFDVAGLRTGAGNPAWWRKQPIAQTSAPAVSALLAAGARWAGKTVTDELASSLTGSNVHYGTPVNPADPRRLPGGSSSGSAVAVAGGHAEIALATDCGGSARLPASYCGIWGIRPSHGCAGMSGFPLAPSFDTVGWFTASGKVLMDVLHVVVPDARVREPRSWVVPEDALAICGPEVRVAMANLLMKLDLPRKSIPAGTLPLNAWANAYRVLAGAEIWMEHGHWVAENGAHLADNILKHFMAASRIGAEEIRQERLVRETATQILAEILSDDAIILMPTVPGPAPSRCSPAGLLAEERHRVQQLVSAAGLAGLPQVSMPWIKVDGAPVGLSLIGARANDGAVIHAARSLEKLFSCNESI
ncbi:amidase [Bordetella petrii]|uniref:amidase n=1 Tax=Bordetella petrii TaxID=94624 RepID=UPI001E63622F|nr:amidase [Bordetella petrii]MCD0502758.1 amidase [Bordetella petrii]